MWGGWGIGGERGERGEGVAPGVGVVCVLGGRLAQGDLCGARRARSTMRPCAFCFAPVFSSC